MVEVGSIGRLGNNLLQCCLGRIWATRLGYGLKAAPIAGFPETRRSLHGRSHRAEAKEVLADTTVLGMGLAPGRGTEREAALFEGPIEYVRANVLPERRKVRRKRYRDFWWLHVEPCTGMREALAGLPRYIGTPTLTKNRLFAWPPEGTLSDHELIAIAREDDYTFSVLHSRVHELWGQSEGNSVA